jgi:F0F1-type ATP synthase assembly protein I
MDFKWARDYGTYAYLGLMLPSSIIVGVGLGYLIDRWLHIHPWGKLAGFLFGVAAGTWNFIKDYQQLTKKKSNDIEKN